MVQRFIGHHLLSLVWKYSVTYSKQGHGVTDLWNTATIGLLHSIRCYFIGRITYTFTLGHYNIGKHFYVSWIPSVFNTSDSFAMNENIITGCVIKKKLHYFLIKCPVNDIRNVL